MNKNKKSEAVLFKLNKLLDKKRKILFVFLLFLAIFHSLIEATGISIIMPFINAASNPEVINEGV